MPFQPETATLGTSADGLAAPEPSGGDDTIKLQALLSYSPGKTIKLRTNRTYKVSDTLTVPSGTTLDLNGATLDFTTMRTGDPLTGLFGIQAFGQVGADISATNSIPLWGRTVSGLSSTAGLAAGNLILLRNDEPATPGQQKSFRDKGELNTITSVDSASQITLRDGALHAYANTGLVIQKLTPTENVTIRNGNIKMGGVGKVHSAFLAKYGRNITVKDVRIDGAEDIAIYLATVLDSTVAGNTILNSPSPANWSTGYGVAIMEGSRYSRVEGNYFENCRHFVTGGGYWPAAFVDVLNNQGERSTGYAYDCHESTLYWRFAGNTAAHCAGGFVIRGQHISVDDNLVLNSTGRGIRIFAWDGVSEQVGIKVMRNRVFGAAQGVEVDGKSDGSLNGDGSLNSVSSVKRDITITDNTIRDVTGPGVLLRHFEGATVHGNRVTGSPTSIECAGLSAAEPSIGLLLSGNATNAPTAYGIKVTDVLRLTLAGNTANDSPQYGIAVTGCFDATIDGCRAYRGNFAGLVITGGARIAITGGVYSDSYNPTNGDGISINSSTDVSVTGTITTNPRYGVNCSTTDYLVMTGNNWRNNGNAAKYRVDAAAVSKVVANNL